MRNKQNKVRKQNGLERPGSQDRPALTLNLVHTYAAGGAPSPTRPGAVNRRHTLAAGQPACWYSQSLAECP